MVDKCGVCGRPKITDIMVRLPTGKFNLPLCSTCVQISLNYVMGICINCSGMTWVDRILARDMVNGNIPKGFTVLLVDDCLHCDGLVNSGFQM